MVSHQYGLSGRAVTGAEAKAEVATHASSEVAAAGLLVPRGVGAARAAAEAEERRWGRGERQRRWGPSPGGLRLENRPRCRPPLYRGSFVTSAAGTARRSGELTRSGALGGLVGVSSGRRCDSAAPRSAPPHVAT
eukprot:1189117-Prorocentrum_minimum.AAC.2